MSTAQGISQSLIEKKEKNLEVVREASFLECHQNKIGLLKLKPKK